MPKPLDLIGAAAAARILNISVVSVHRWATNGRLTVVGTLDATVKNSAVVFHRAEVEALAAKLAADTDGDDIQAVS